MKKGTMIGITAALLLVLALGGLALYLALNYNRKAVESSSEKAESEADAAMQALLDSAKEPETRTESEAADDDAPLIWAGDSRTIGMRDAMKNGDIYIGAAGEGYDWLSAEGLPLIKEAITQNPSSPVIFNFGVNDYDNLERYLALYQELTAEYPDTVFWFLAVNPIDPEVCKNITNEEISDFNAHLKEQFPDTFLDSYTWMMVEEVRTKDGIHYTAEDYRRLHAYVSSRLS